MNTEKATKMMKKFKKRIDKELNINEENKGFDFAYTDTTWYFQFVIEDGLYKGQKHILEVKLVYGTSPNIYIYPVNAPMCRFITPVWHPNISARGTICLDVLKDNWSPSMFTATIISAIKMLLINPEPSSPQNPKAGQMIRKDPEKYKKYVSEFYDYEKVPEHIKQLLYIH